PSRSFAAPAAGANARHFRCRPPQSLDDAPFGPWLTTFARLAHSRPPRRVRMPDTSVVGRLNRSTTRPSGLGSLRSPVSLIRGLRGGCECPTLPLSAASIARRRALRALAHYVRPSRSFGNKV